MPPTGIGPGYATDDIFVSLRAHSKRTKQGLAVGDTKCFRVDLPRRTWFSRGAASGMPFFEGRACVAVEVRSGDDYGSKARYTMAAKRADYFAAGTRVM